MSSDSIAGKKYMVYFVQSPFTRNFVNSWVCGGALVTPTQVLTAASCLIEGGNIYAIAGYKKYISAKNIDINECTRTKKQRVIKMLIPVGYELDYDILASKIDIDIGVAVVEKPYVYNDFSFLTHCSYEPQLIRVNYDSNYEAENTNAAALTWGVEAKTPKSINQTTYQLLQEISTMIVDKKVCTDNVEGSEVVPLINKYHICGTINFQGTFNKQEIEPFHVYQTRRHNSDSKNFLEFRRNNNEDNNDAPLQENNEYLKENTSDNQQESICQNNIGTPLIKFINSKEVIIGVTSSTTINSGCNGPFLYVSTAATSEIIRCLLESDPFTRTRCNLKINEEPYDIHEIDVKWPNYQQTQLLEPLLLVQRAVLDKIEPIIPRPTVNFKYYKKNSKIQERDYPSYGLPQKKSQRYNPEIEHQKKLHHDSLSIESSPIQHNKQLIKSQYIREQLPFQIPSEYHPPPQYPHEDLELLPQHRPSRKYDRLSEKRNYLREGQKLPPQQSDHKQVYKPSENQPHHAKQKQYVQQPGLQHGILSIHEHDSLIAQEQNEPRQQKELLKRYKHALDYTQPYHKYRNNMRIDSNSQLHLLEPNKLSSYNPSIDSFQERPAEFSDKQQKSDYPTNLEQFEQPTKLSHDEIVSFGDILAKYHDTKKTKRFSGEKKQKVPLRQAFECNGTPDEHPEEIIHPLDQYEPSTIVDLKQTAMIRSQISLNGEYDTIRDDLNDG